MLKRSSKASFFPNAYVFPGGNIDKADSSFRWFSVFHLLTRNVESLGQNFIVHQHDEMRSPMFKNGKNNVNSGLPNEISLRISAIRETFEETGILIAHSTHENSMSPLPENNWYCSVIEWDHAEVEIWRSKVREDANEFLNLCIQNKYVPDIWALHEWSNWLTPTFMPKKNSKRYDTVFYKACLKSPPSYTKQDNSEVICLNWESPSTTLLSYHNQKIILAPPQVYELGRLLNFKQHQVLARFTSKRRLKGLSRWLPVRAQSTDGVLMSLLPDTTEKPPNERSTEKVKRCKFDTLSSDEKSDNEDQSETVSPVPQSTRTTMQQPWLQAKHKGSKRN
uniref:nucleoside diphosphate-linked moiety X motif 19-like isoform X3 n=1 Tax=Ciona intestinalis TaxID=7719 RepID=UPI000EF54E96|nr:nucleoside diphosphate-linked moiety X motif 19-like isoform X3 [Ciona intestinalis]|eukprot:XP_026693998.1 nucleoside diphosphate-linked moiety X motif 19-like isoform X3 [Ciona intestinalis]